MIPKLILERTTDGHITLTISEEAANEVLDAIIRYAYGEGYEDGQMDNIRPI